MSCDEAALDAALVGGGVVDFDCGGPATIVFTSPKTITVNTVLDGSPGIVLSGGFTVNLFEVTGGSLEVNGLTLANGRDSMASPGGAAIRSDGQAVTIRDSVIRGHVSSEGGCPAINVADAGLVIERSTIHRNVNQAASTGHPVCINAGATAFVSNTTITDNTGGSFRASGTAILLNTTIAENRGTGGNRGGPSAFFAGAAITLVNSLVIDNENGQCSESAGGIVIDGGGNFQFPDADCGGTIPVADPGLAPLADNGGPTPTMAISFPSVAIDAASQADCPGTDQRGEFPADGDGNGSVLCDSGAFEATGGVPVTAVPLADPVGLAVFALLLLLAARRVLST